MAAPKVNKNNVEQTINLKDEFGIDFSGRRPLRELIGQAIIDKIRSRTADGQGMRFGRGGSGTPVKLKSPYSKEYSKSLEFRAFGKSRSKVNMSLTGDMMGLMDIKKQTGNTLTVGWDEKEENNKAFNHMSGDTVPTRPFFGVSKVELQDIKREFRSDIKEAIKIKKDGGSILFNRFVVGLIKKIKGDGNSES